MVATEQRNTAREGNSGNRLQHNLLVMCLKVLQISIRYKQLLGLVRFSKDSKTKYDNLPSCREQGAKGIDGVHDRGFYACAKKCALAASGVVGMRACIMCMLISASPQLCAARDTVHLPPLCGSAHQSTFFVEFCGAFFFLPALWMARNKKPIARRSIYRIEQNVDRLSWPGACAYPVTPVRCSSLKTCTCRGSTGRSRSLCAVCSVFYELRVGVAMLVLLWRERKTKAVDHLPWSGYVFTWCTSVDPSRHGMVVVTSQGWSMHAHTHACKPGLYA